MKEKLLVVLLLVVGFGIGMYYGTNEIEENKQEYETQIESQIDDSLLFLLFLRVFCIYYNEKKGVNNMKLKNAIILGIGFSIGKFIFNFTVQFVDRAVDLGNDILEVMQNDGISFESSVDKVLESRKRNKTKQKSKESNKIIGFTRNPEES